MKQFYLPILGVALFAACSTMADDTHTTKTDKNSTMREKSSVASSTAISASLEKVFPYEVQRAELDNGLHVLMIPMPSDGLVSYWSVVRTGSRDEVEAGVTGFAHFFEHMMFRGTEKLPGTAYDRIVNGMGADANAFTSDDMTAYHLSFAKESLPRVIEIEADRFQNLKYTEGQFKTESGAVYGEYRKGRSSPFEVLDESARNVAFDKHTYKHTTIGFEADIVAMPTRYDYSKTFFQRFYRPENVVVLVTGDFDPKATLATIKKEYGAWKKGYQAPAITPEPAQTAQRRLDIPFDGRTQPLLALNFKGPAYKPGDRAWTAARLIGDLAFGPTSPLYKKLVLDEQKVEALGGTLDYNRDPGLWTVYALVKDAKDVHAIEAELWKAIDDLRKTPIATERLDAVRSNMRYSFLSNLSTPAEVAESIARFIALTGDVTCVDTMFTTLASVTPEDVRKAADTWLRPENCTVATLHTKGEDIPSTSFVIGDAKVEVAASASKSTREAAAEHESTNAATTSIVNTRAVHQSITDASSPKMEFTPLVLGDVVSQAPVLLPVAQDPTVSFRIWFQVGSQDDPIGKEGLAAMVGALVGEGATKKNAYDQILTKLFPMAASYGVNVDKEMTVVSGSVHRDHALDFYQLLVEAITLPKFEASDFERLRDQAISNIENDLRFASGEELGKATLTEKVFHGTRYAHIGIGTVASLKAMTIDDVKNFYGKYWTRDNVVIGLGGSYASDLPQKMRSDLGALGAGKPERVAKPAIEKIQGRQVTLVDNKDAIGSSISMGVPIDVLRGSKDFYALWIANSYLGEHRNSASHLYQVIREERGINYGDYSYIQAFPGGGGRRMPPQGVGRRQQMFEVWVRTVPTENTLFSLRAALREIEMLVEKGMTKEQFEFQKGFLKGYSTHFAESTFERLGYALDDRFYGIDGHLVKFRKMMDEITLDDVNSAIKKYMKVDDLAIAIVTKDATGLKTAIAAGTPTPVVYPKGVVKPAEIVSEDKLIEAWPLKIDAAKIVITAVAAMFEGGAARPSMR